MYRNGHDSIAWHSDDEYGLGKEPNIASLSLGDTRYFEMMTKKHAVSFYQSIKVHDLETYVDSFRIVHTDIDIYVHICRYTCKHMYTYCVHTVDNVDI